MEYSKIQDDPTIFNLAFGDEDPVTGKLNDRIVTDNNDRDIVLATVANTIKNFNEHHGNNFIYMIGSTPARTRLYQMAIAEFWLEIKIDFDVFGYKTNNWHVFQKGINYEAFLVKKK